MVVDLADIARETIKYTLEDILDEVKKNKSYVGMIIASRTLDTEEKVKNFYGGEKWQRIRGRTLVGAGDDFPIGTEGGEKEHVLSWHEMPRHSHGVHKHFRFGIAAFEQQAGEGIGKGGTHRVAEVYEPFSVAESGENWAHNNMPPYKVCYIWERIE